MCQVAARVGRLLRVTGRPDLQPPSGVTNAIVAPVLAGDLLA
jgi:hypothetical protein